MKNPKITLPILSMSLNPVKEEDTGRLLNLKSKNSESLFGNVGTHVVGCSASVTDFSEQKSQSESFTKGKSGFLAKDGDDDKLTPETIFAIASCTKMLAAATILRMTEVKETAKQFPKGINTPLSHFVPALKRRFPDSTFIKNIESQDHYKDITLRDLLQHTHGMGDWKVRGKRTNIPKKSEYGTHAYSKTGPELIALIVETVADKPFAEVVRDLVIKPLGLKNTLMHDEIEKPLIDGSRKMAHGYGVNNKPFEDGDYVAGKAAWGSRSTPTDMNKFTRAFLTQNLKDSLFENPETLKEMQKMHKVPESEQEAGSPYIAYGLGCGKFSNGLIGHDGVNRAFKAQVRYDPSKDKCATVCYVEEHASLIMADSLFAGLSKDELLRSQKEILKQYSPEQLINDYENTRSDFLEKHKSSLVKEIKETWVEKTDSTPVTDEKFSDKVQQKDNTKTFGK